VNEGISLRLTLLPFAASTASKECEVRRRWLPPSMTDIFNWLQKKDWVCERMSLSHLAKSGIGKWQDAFLRDPDSYV
jgi:hypothetical protein